MQAFDYAAPQTLDEALRLLAEHGEQAVMLAGGTDILVQLREGDRAAKLVVDTKHIAELTGVALTDGGLSLGASAPCWKIYEDEAVAGAYPALADAARIIGGWQIQSRASFGGNLCNASPAADTVPAMIACGGLCRIAGPGGERTLAVEDFCTAPGENALGEGEMLLSIEFPASPPHCGSAYQRFIPRNEMDIAVVGAGSWLVLDNAGATVRHARIGLCGVAPRPVLAVAAGEFLVGKEATEENFAAAGELAKQVADPIDDKRGTAEYRTHLTGVLTRRTLLAAAERARS